MTKQIRIASFIRGQSALDISEAAHETYCHLGPAQPLLLHREPDNPVDSNAILLTDLLGSPCGYVAREQAPQVAQLLDSGEMLTCHTAGRCFCVIRGILITSEGEEAEKKDEASKKLPSRLVREPEDA